MALADLESDRVERGSILRVGVAGGWLDVLLVEHPDSPSGYALMIVTGYEAGLVLAQLPNEARSDPGISRDWLERNLRVWTGADERSPLICETLRAIW